MSLWIFTEEKLEIGQKYRGYTVADIQHKVSPSVLVINYGNKQRGLQQDPEIKKQCVRLV